MKMKMKIKDIKHERIIICFKEKSFNPSKTSIQSFLFKGLNNSNINFKISRLHSIEDDILSFKTQNKDNKSYDFSLKDEAFFDKYVYNSFEKEPKKKLFRTFNIASDDENSLNELYKLLITNFNDEIEYIQFDEGNELYEIPDDPAYTNNQLWGLNKIQCLDAWALSRGKDILVAVIDTGININHKDINPDQGSNLWKDANGRYGYFYYYHNNNATTVRYSQNNSDIKDREGHGSHLSGSIAGIKQNTLDIIGVAPESKIITFKCFDVDYKILYDSLCAEAIRKAVYVGAKVINISWGREGNHNNCVIQAIDYAHSENVVVVCAAGNYNKNVSNYTPAGYSNIISVGATAEDDKKYINSNYGNITIASPGVAINSLNKNVSSGFHIRRGTSMAAAYISGVVALILYKKKNLNPSAVKHLIITSGYDNIQVQTDEGTVNWKRINALKCVQ